MKPTFYEILGLSNEASQAEIKHAYRRLSKTAHPDKEGTPALFRLINEAYDVLSDTREREAYDHSLNEGSVVEAPPGPSIQDDPPGQPGFGPTSPGWSGGAPPSPPSSAPPPSSSPPGWVRPTDRTARKSRVWQFVGPLAAVLVVLMGIGLIGELVDSIRQSIGDACLVGTWRLDNDYTTLPYSVSLEGQTVTAPLHGGSGQLVSVASNGATKSDFSGAAPLTGSVNVVGLLPERGYSYQIEGRYVGTRTARWHTTDGIVHETDRDDSRLRFRVTVNGRPHGEFTSTRDQNYDFRYRCSSTTLEMNEYRYTRQ